MGEVKLFGHQFKPWQVWVVGIGGAGATYIVWRQHKATAAASSSTGTDPLTGLPVSEDGQIDPVTGQTYLAEAQEYGSVSAAEAASSSGAGYESSAYGGGTTGTSYGTTGLGGSTVLGTTGTAAYASIADYDQAVTAGLASIGYSETDVASALGRYVGGLSLDADQQNIINVALAEFGPPPGGPYSIIAAASTGTATTGSTTTTATGGTATGGAPTSGTTATAVSKVSGGKSAVSANGASVSWTPSGPAKSWKVTLTGPGSQNGHTATVSKPEAVYTGLESGHDYEVTVQPEPSGTAGKISFKTT